MKKLLLSLLPLAVSNFSGLVAAPPNIVFMLVDDMGYGDIGCYGAPDAKTPVLDKLAQDGIRFTQMYSNGAECTPARTAFLTGRYPQYVGGLECAIGTGNVGRYDDAIRLADNSDLGLPANEAILAPALKQAGYHNGVFGKWHLGYESKFSPLDQGFDEFVGFLGGNVDYFTHTELSPLDVFIGGRKPIKRKGYMTHLITDDAVDFVKRNSKKPFFLYVPFSTPHFPFQGPKDDTGKMHPKETFMIGTREKYVEMLEDMDRSVGRILKSIDDAGIRGNTLVVFASDHGAMKPGRNLPFSGWKGGLMEGGLRVPVIARWPGRLKAGTVSRQPGTLMDLTASFLRVAGAKKRKDRKLSGIDILKHVQDGRDNTARTFYWRARRGDRTWRAIRDDAMKYVYKIEGGQEEEWLFDLSTDPAEEKNLLSKQPKTAKKLKSRLVKWEGKVKAVR
ncbi:MAG: N-acetylgalactosamine-6-sulfatase [Verrucomicrobiales bacterium]|nr:N-acetylgalactosamine-6-sulfatase [Verrucomicrobiales bacterium]